MKILLIKTSSLGDILHVLPALTDAAAYFPEISVDWVVEKSFQEIPQLHKKVRRVIPLEFRQWRKNLFSAKTWKALGHFIKMLRQEKYDAIIDAQGLVKSAWLACVAKGPSMGLDWASAREPFASLFYRHHVTVNFQKHAITRMRELFAKTLHYPVPTTLPAALDKQDFIKPPAAPEAYLLFLHGTTWSNKKWPLLYWQSLARQAAEAGLTVYLPWSTPEEQDMALQIQQHLSQIHILPPQTLSEMAAWIAHAKKIVAVDTGLGHLAAAFGTPTLSLYGPTNPAFTGAMGPHQTHLVAQFPCAPCLQKMCAYTGEIKTFPACFTTIPPEKVWEALQKC